MFTLHQTRPPAPQSNKAELFTRFLRQDGGATAIEYALIGSLVAVSITGAVTVMGTRVQGLIAQVVGAF